MSQEQNLNLPIDNPSFMNDVKRCFIRDYFKYIRQFIAYGMGSDRFIEFRWIAECFGTAKPPYFSRLSKDFTAEDERKFDLKVFNALNTFLLLTDQSKENPEYRNIRQAVNEAIAVIMYQEPPKGFLELLNMAHPLFEFLMKSFIGTGSVVLDADPGKTPELNDDLLRLSQLIKDPGINNDIDWANGNLEKKKDYQGKIVTDWYVNKITKKERRIEKDGLLYSHLRYFRDLRNKKSEAHYAAFLLNPRNIGLFYICIGVLVVYYIQNTEGLKANLRGVNLNKYVKEHANDYLINCKVVESNEGEVGEEIKKECYVKPFDSDGSIGIKWDYASMALGVKSITVDEEGNIVDKESPDVQESPLVRKINEFYEKSLSQPDKSTSIDELIEQVKDFMANTKSNESLTAVQQEDLETWGKGLIDKVKCITNEQLNKVFGSLTTINDQLTQIQAGQESIVTQVTQNTTDAINQGFKDQEERRKQEEARKAEEARKSAETARKKTVRRKRIKIAAWALVALILLDCLSGAIYLHNTTKTLRQPWVDIAHLVGNPDAAYNYAKLCQDEAVKMMHQGGAQGYDTYLNNQILRQKIKDSGAYYRKAIDRYESLVNRDSVKNADRAIRLAEMHLAGQGGTMNYSKAINWAQKAPFANHEGFIAFVSASVGDYTSAEKILKDLKRHNRKLDEYAMLTDCMLGLDNDSLGGRNSLDLLHKMVDISNNGKGLLANFACINGLNFLRRGYIDHDGSIQAQFFYPIMTNLSLGIEQLFMPALANAIIDFNGLFDAIDMVNLDLLLTWDMGLRANVNGIQKRIDNGLLVVDDITREEIYQEFKRQENSKNAAALLTQSQYNYDDGDYETAWKNLNAALSHVSVYDSHLFINNPEGIVSGLLEFGTDSLMKSSALAKYLSTCKPKEIKMLHDYLDAACFFEGRGGKIKDLAKTDSLLKNVSDSGAMIARVALAKRMLYKIADTGWLNQGNNGYITSWPFNLKDQGFMEPINSELRGGEIKTWAMDEITNTWVLKTRPDSINKSLNEVKALLQHPADSGFGDASVLMAYVCDRLGQPSQRDYYHKKALESFDIIAVVNEVMPHGPSLNRSEEDVLKDIKLIESALSFNNPQRPGVSSQAWQKAFGKYLEIANSTLIDSDISSFGNDQYFNLSRVNNNFGIDYEVLPNVIISNLVNNQRKDAETAFVCYMYQAARNKAIHKSDIKISERVRLDNLDGVNLSNVLPLGGFKDENALYLMMVHFFPHTENQIIALLGYDPFVNAREFVKQNIDALFSVDLAIKEEVSYPKGYWLPRTPVFPF